MPKNHLRFLLLSLATFTVACNSGGSEAIASSAEAAPAAPAAPAVTGAAITGSFRTIGASELPSGINWSTVTEDASASGDSKIETAATWKEGTSTMYAALAVSKQVNSKSKNSSGALYASVFQETGGALNLVRTVKQLESGCEYDLTAEFRPAAFGLTNLDNDAEGELTFAYVTRCTSDLSPASLKLVMLEGKSKFIIRGTTITAVGDGEEAGGESNAEFGGAPPSFLSHAEQIWQTVVAF